MGRLLGVLAGVLVVGVLAHPTHAHQRRVGYIEVCKAANPALTGQFGYSVHTAAGVATLTIGLGTCSKPIPVAPGPVTVVEEGSLTGLLNDGTVDPNPQTDFLSAKTTAVGPEGPLPPGTGFSYTVKVPPSPGGSQNVVTVTYENELVTGVVEVCKQTVSGTGLTGSWSFTITGANQFSQVVTVPGGHCSPPVVVPAGKVKVQETGDAAVAVTDITATRTASNVDVVLGPRRDRHGHGPKPDLASATVVAAVVAGDASEPTIVSMTNTSVRLKLCKYADRGLTSLATSTFTFVTEGNAGPNGPIAPLSLAAGTSVHEPVCTVVGSFRAGTTVTITEDIAPDTKVGSIDVNPPDRLVVGSLDLANRSAGVVLGWGETVVTYENIPARPGLLKICKVADPSPPPIPEGKVFSFTVSDGARSKKVSVPAGSCLIDGPYVFNATLKVVEEPETKVKVKAIQAVPEAVMVVIDGATRPTKQAVLSAVDLGARSASVTIGENNITELTFVNVDPPGAVSAVGASTTPRAAEPAAVDRRPASSPTVGGKLAAVEAQLKAFRVQYATAKDPAERRALTDRFAQLYRQREALRQQARR